MQFKKKLQLLIVYAPVKGIVQFNFCVYCSSDYDGLLVYILSADLSHYIVCYACCMAALLSRPFSSRLAVNTVPRNWTLAKVNICKFWKFEREIKFIIRQWIYISAVGSGIVHTELFREIRTFAKLNSIFPYCIRQLAINKTKTVFILFRS